MPTTAEIIADPSLRAQCEWVLLDYLPSETFLLEDLGPLKSQIPPIPFTGEVLVSGEAPGYYLLQQRCTIGPLPEPSTGVVKGFAIVFPPDPDGLLGLGELPGGYEMGSGDTIEFLLSALVPVR